VSTKRGQSHGGLNWATEDDLPPLTTVGQIAELVAGDIGLIELEVDIAGWGIMRSHDDAECDFTIHARSDLMAVLARVIAPEQLGRMTNILLQRSGQYVAFSPDGAEVKYFATFDDYVSWSHPGWSKSIGN